jgi:putative ABC transport system permease protein
MVVGIAAGRPGATPGWPPYLVAGRQITRGHYEAVADVASGFASATRMGIRRNQYTVVGLTRRMVSSAATRWCSSRSRMRRRRSSSRTTTPSWQQSPPHRGQPGVQPPGVPGLLDAVIASQSTNPYVNAVLVTLAPGHAPDEVAESIRRWKRLTVYTRAQMEGILVGKLIATSARQIGMFLVILAVVSAAIVAFIIYTLTMDKIREIAVLKLIGTRNRTIAAMILQQAVALGLIGFVVGKITATFGALLSQVRAAGAADTVAASSAVMAICVLASLVSIRHRAARSIRPKRSEAEMDRPTRAGKGILIEGLTKRYGKGDTAVDALKGVDMRSPRARSSA